MKAKHINFSSLLPWARYTCPRSPLTSRRVWRVRKGCPKIKAHKWPWSIPHHIPCHSNIQTCWLFSVCLPRWFCCTTAIKCEIDFPPYIFIQTNEMSIFSIKFFVFFKGRILWKLCSKQTYVHILQVQIYCLLSKGQPNYCTLLCFQPKHCFVVHMFIWKKSSCFHALTVICLFLNYL